MRYLSEDELAQSINRLVRVNTGTGTARAFIRLDQDKYLASIVYHIDLSKNRCELLDDSEIDLSILKNMLDSFQANKRSVYTYHHDYIRTSFTSMSRSNVAELFDKIERRLDSDYYLYACSIVQMLNGMTTSQALKLVTPGQIGMLRKCIEFAEAELESYRKLIEQ